MNIWNRIVEWFSDRSERDRLLLNFNNSAKEAFINGMAPTMLKAKISRGCKEYHHKYSSWLSSGFRIEVFSGRQLSKDEIKLSDKLSYPMMCLSDGSSFLDGIL